MNLFGGTGGKMAAIKQAGKNLAFFLEEILEALSLSSQK
jgi:hypothetical protein